MPFQRFDFRTPFGEEPEDNFAGPIRRGLAGGMERPQLTAIADPEENEEEDIYTKTMKTLSQSGPNMQNYMKHVSESPKREDYQPNWMTKIAAALGGGAEGMRDPSRGIQTALAIRDEPYRRGVEDYERKGAGLGALAQNEDSERRNQLGLIKAIRENQLEERRLQSTEKTADASVTRANASVTTANTNKQYREALVADLKTKGFNFHEDDKGNRIATKIVDGQVVKHNLGSSIETTKLKNEERKIGQTDVRNKLYGRFAGAAETNAAANATRAARPPASAFITPTNQFTAEFMATRKALEENSDWSGFVDADGNIRKAYENSISKYFGGQADSVTDQGFREFLQAVERHRTAILGMQRPGSQDPEVFNVPDNFLDGEP